MITLHYQHIFIRDCTILTDVGDSIELVVTNETILIPPGYTMGCFELMAVNDDVVEIDDRANAVIVAGNPNDRLVNDTTLIILIDNDSTCQNNNRSSIVIMIWCVVVCSA